MKEENAGIKRAGLLLALAGFCLYLQTLFQSFISDDNIYLAFKNKLLRHSTWADWYRPLIERANPWEYLPLRDFSYWLDFRLYHYEGMGFHATNLIWYALGALAAGLLFRELILLCRPGWANRAATLAGFGAALFIVHPVHVEAVAWVASRKDVMSGCFAFLSALMLVNNIRSRQWSYGGSVLSALLLLAACFSKAAGVTMVLFEITVILSYWRRPSGSCNAFSDTRIKFLRKLTPLILLCTVAALSVYVSMKVGEETHIRVSGNTIPMMDIIERASRILTALLKLLVWPSPLSFYHDVYAQGPWHWGVSTFTVAAALAALFALWLQPTLWAFGVILMLAPCLVYLQFTPFGTWSFASERFAFIPVAGLALIVIEVCGRLTARHALALVLILFLPCAWLTWQRIMEWDDPKHLRELDYERAPMFHNSIRDRIFIMTAKGDMVEAKRLSANLGRPWATEAMDALIDVETAYGNEHSLGKALADSMRKAGQEDGSGHGIRDLEDDITVHTRDIHAFCQSMPRLRATIAAGQAALVHEPDQTYAHILGSLKGEVRDRYDYFERQNCPTYSGN